MLQFRFAIVSTLMVLIPALDERGADAKLKDTARNVRSKYQDAVIRVQITKVNELLGAAETDIRTGTVVTADGITAISLAQHEYPEANYKLKGVRIILANGREVAAKLIGHDKEHDLAFVSPLEKLNGLVQITFSKNANVELLEEVVQLYRMSEDLAEVDSQLVALGEDPQKAFLERVGKADEDIILEGTATLRSDVLDRLAQAVGRQ